jgi:hypothetical protein
MDCVHNTPSYKRIETIGRIRQTAAGSASKGSVPRQPSSPGVSTCMNAGRKSQSPDQEISRVPAQIEPPT